METAEKKEQSFEVEVEKFDTAAARRTPPEWLLSVTKPVRRILSNIDHEVVNNVDDPVEALKSADERAVFIFDEPEDGRLDGIIEIGTEVPGGRSATNARAITVSNTSLNLWITGDEFQAMGVEADIDAGILPVVEVWGGDNVLSLRAPREKEVAYHQSPQMSLYELPQQMREDFEAVYLGDYTAEEWADERGLPSPDTGEPGLMGKTVVKRNVNTAVERLGEEIITQLERQGSIDDSEMHGEEVNRDFYPTDHAQIRPAESGYRITITDAVRSALPDSEQGKPAALMYDILNGGEWGVPATIDTYETDDDTPTGYGSDRVRKLQVHPSIPGADDPEYKYRVKVPNPVLDQLGYDPDHAGYEYLNILSLEDGGAIAFERPPRATIRVGPIEINEVSATRRYTEAIEAAADAVGEPLTLREYEAWANEQSEYHPSGVTIATSESAPGDSASWKSVCEAIGITPGEPQYIESIQTAADDVDGVLTVKAYEQWRENQSDIHLSGNVIGLLHSSGWSGACTEAGVSHGDVRSNDPNQYNEYLTAAVADIGEPLTTQRYDAWRQEQSGTYPSSRTISAVAPNSGGWKQACEDAGVTPAAKGP